MYSLVILPEGKQSKKLEIISGGFGGNDKLYTNVGSEYCILLTNFDVSGKTYITEVFKIKTLLVTFAKNYRKLCNFIHIHRNKLFKVSLMYFNSGMFIKYAVLVYSVKLILKMFYNDLWTKMSVNTLIQFF